MYLRKLLIAFFICFSSFAAQVAVITVPKAVVFADLKLTTPLGYISYGKKVHVGEVERKDGTVLPIILSGRVAYIQVKDLSLNRAKASAGIDSPKITEHDIELTFKTDKDKLSENNFISFSLGTYSAGESWQTYSEEFNDSTSSLFNWSLQFEHRTPVKRLSWGFGISYYSVSQEQLQAKTLTLDGTLYYALVHFKYVTIEGFGGLSFSGDFQISQGGGEQKTKGVLYGYNFGGIARILPFSTFGFYAGAAIKNFYIKDIEPIENAQGDEVTIGNLSGASIYAGLSYKF